MNGDITSEALRRCQRASKVISPFIIFAVFDVSFRRYKLQVTLFPAEINYSFFYIYICCFIIADQMSTAGVFWSRNLCLSVIMLHCTKFRVNQTINRPDIAGKKTIFIMAAVCMLNLQNCGTLSCDRPWKSNLRLHTKFR